MAWHSEQLDVGISVRSGVYDITFCSRIRDGDKSTRGVRLLTGRRYVRTKRDSPANVFMLDIIFLLVTAVIAYHGLTWRDEEGESDFVRLLFGTIALLFFFRVLLVDVLGVWG